MNVLDHPQAQPLLADAELPADALDACADHLTAFAERYLPRFRRSEHRGHALTVLRGKLTGLQRKSGLCYRGTALTVCSAKRWMPRKCPALWQWR